jgi:hypothetical protein
MKELIDSIRLQIYERLSSPLFGSLVLAWLGWNYRLVTVMVSNLPVEKKFEFIDTKLYVTAWDCWGKALGFPLLTALLFILVYPHPAKWVFGYWHRRQQEQKKLRDKIEGATLLTEQESIAIRKELYGRQAEHGAEIAKLQKQIEDLTTSSDVGKPTVLALPAVTPVPPALKPDIPDIPEGTLRIVGILAKSATGLVPREHVVRTMDEPRVKVDYYIDQGVSRKLFSTTRATAGAQEHLELTQKGREFAVQAKYV